MPQALPANPNLDWLRKAAKKRFAELRALLAACSAPQSAAAKCAIWSACAFRKAGRAVARAT